MGKPRPPPSRVPGRRLSVGHRGLKYSVLLWEMESLGSLTRVRAQTPAVSESATSSALEVSSPLRGSGALFPPLLPSKSFVGFFPPGEVPTSRNLKQSWMSSGGRVPNGGKAN